MDRQGQIHQMLLRAGNLAMQHFCRVEPQWKDEYSPVTEADLAVQKFVVEWLQKEHPDDGIIAEEEGVSVRPRKGDRYWTVDPIDGTASFVAGFPVWGIGLGLLEAGRPKEGYFYLPTTGDYYSCVSGVGVFRNGYPASMKTPEALNSGSLLLTTSRQHQHIRPSPRYHGKIRSLGSTIGHLCSVATGGADAALLGRVWLWDILPGWTLLRENGGILKYLGGALVELGAFLKDTRASGLIIAGHPDVVDAYESVLVSLGRSRR